MPDFETFMRRNSKPRSKTKGSWKIRRKTRYHHDPAGLIILDVNDPRWERRPKMNTHAVLIMGESRVGKSSIIARVCHSSSLFPSQDLWTDNVHSIATACSHISTTQAGTATAKKSPSTTKRTRSSSKTSAPTSRPTSPSTCATASSKPQKASCSSTTSPPRHHLTA